MSGDTTEFGEGEHALGRDATVDPPPDRVVVEPEVPGDLRDPAGALDREVHDVEGLLAHGSLRYNLYLSFASFFATADDTGEHARDSRERHPVAMSIAERIALLRHAKGLDQYALAAEIGVSRPAISAWETGRVTPRPDAIHALAVYFGTTTDYLIAGVEAPANDDERFSTAFRSAPAEVRRMVMDLLAYSQRKP